MTVASPTRLFFPTAHPPNDTTATTIANLLNIAYPLRSTTVLEDDLADLATAAAIVHDDAARAGTLTYDPVAWSGIARARLARARLAASGIGAPVATVKAGRQRGATVYLRSDGASLESLREPLAVLAALAGASRGAVVLSFVSTGAAARVAA